jgi:DnaA-homolog protein
VLGDVQTAGTPIFGKGDDNDKVSPMKQLALDITPSPLPALSRFVPGRNAELLQALSAMLARPVKERFIYLWGVPGSGKSHLLQAMAALSMRNQVNTAYFACNSKTCFSDRGEADCTLVDDADRLEDGAQIGLFNLYNRILERDDAVLLVSGSSAPAQLKLREDLMTRLGWGLVYRVHELTDAEKIEAMQNHALSRGLELSTDVCDYLLRHERRDLTTLMATIDALDNYSMSNRRKVTIPLARELLQELS